MWIRKYKRGSWAEGGRGGRVAETYSCIYIHNAILYHAVILCYITLQYITNDIALLYM